VDKISALNQRNPVLLAKQIGQRLKAVRLGKGWTQEELSDRSGLAVSTLKLLEAKGQGSFQRLIRVTIALGIDGEIRNLFSDQTGLESIDALKLSERQRAPRRGKKGADDGS